MITREGDIPNWESSSRDASFSSFKDRYILIDNIDEKKEPIVNERAEIYNTNFMYGTVVLRGTLHMIINDQPIEVKENDYVLVTPYMKVKILESRCLFFSFIVQDVITNDILEHSGICRSVGVRSFAFYHYHFDRMNIELMLTDYRLLKQELILPNYPMHEMAIRAFFTSKLAHLYSFMQEENEIKHSDNSRQKVFYERFLKMLSLYYKKERSVQFYADKINITPKYLSNIVNAFTGYSASVVIDLYVVHRIKQVLYSNNLNIKTISDSYNFPNQSFFGRYFKRIVGKSPNEYLHDYNRKALGNE